MSREPCGGWGCRSSCRSTATTSRPTNAIGPGSLRTLSYARAVIVPSRFLAERVAPLGVPADRIHVIPSGVDVRWFAPTPLPAGIAEVLFVGRFVEKKGLDVLLQAWPAVAASAPGARLRILGSGPMEALARSGGPDVTVEPTDPARRAEQVRDAIRDARIVVTPSKTAADGDAETLLLVNLEAQASGRPLVTTQHGGIPEYVEEGRTALVVPENDADALGDAITRLLTDESLATRLAGAGPELAARFDVAACTARVDALYDRLLLLCRSPSRGSASSSPSSTGRRCSPVVWTRWRDR